MEAGRDYLVQQYLWIMTLVSSIHLSDQLTAVNIALPAVTVVHYLAPSASARSPVGSR